MRVYVYPADIEGCGYYRLIWPARVLQAAGHDIRMIHPKRAGNKISGHMDADGKLVQVSVPKDADVMVFQRVSSEKVVDAIKIMRQNGVAVVIDIDDDMSAIHQHNPAWAALHPKSTGENEEYNWNNALKACRAATLVTVSTDALLARYARRLPGEPVRGALIRNAVPEILLQFPRRDSKIIGWAGTLRTHPDDPQVTGMSMGKLTREGYKFKVVGPQRGVREAFRLDNEPWATGPVPIDQWPHEVNTLGVGIAPLNATRFNEAKSWLKMLEYAAVGVPCIGSPLSEYRRIHALGVGLLATSPKEWYRHAKMLLDNDSIRQEMSEAGRAAVQDLTIEKTAWRWLEAWTTAYQMERGPLGIKPAVRSVPAES